MYAGVKGRGAQDAWYAEVQLTELARPQGERASVTAFDMWKAFDQLSRPALYCLMLRAGWPTRLVCAYMRFQEHLVIHSSFGGSLGVGRKRPTSIPQGCP
eukprot:5496218-Alexandrium_andersonii.AAC.1